ncbi:hypothetical protein C1H46_028378 [Malus baccata]|uniref:Uncharacterized protein n=1 Tax=Malus baccata TaxID=106549 RepID=A0A540LHW3_MALBA|nr:hypothetical protein C1H46_028378 [Malus baccata]
MAKTLNDLLTKTKEAEAALPPVLVTVEKSSDDDISLEKIPCFLKDEEKPEAKPSGEPEAKPSGDWVSTDVISLGHPPRCSHQADEPAYEALEESRLIPLAFIGTTDKPVDPETATRN